jgi:phosphomannomutase
VGEHYYDRIDVHITPELHQKAASNMAKVKVDSVAGTKVARLETADGYKFILEDDSWLLIRFSGTEPLIRIYSEAGSPQKVQDILKVGKSLVGI